MTRRETEPLLFSPEDLPPPLVTPSNRPKTKRRKTPRARNIPIQSYFPGWDDVHLTNYRHGAVVVGDFFEEATSDFFRTTGTSRLITDSGSEVCPDLQQARNEFFLESKGMQKGRHTNIFTHVMEHYADLISMFFPPVDVPDTDWSPSLIFAFWIHGVHEVGKCYWREQLRNRLASNIHRLYLVEFSIVEEMMRHRREEDHSRAGYRPLRRFRETDVKPLQLGSQPFLEKWQSLDPDQYSYTTFTVPSLKVYGRESNPFPVYSYVSRATTAKPAFRSLIQNWTGQDCSTLPPTAPLSLVPDEEEALVLV